MHISRSLTRRPEPMVVTSVHLLYLHHEAVETAQKQRAIPLFSRSPNRWRPRISAENAISFAENFIQKQQKQRAISPVATFFEGPEAGGSGPQCAISTGSSAPRRTCWVKPP